MSRFLQGLQKLITGIVEQYQRDTGPEHDSINKVFVGVWCVFLNGEHIADIKYLYDDPPCHIFEMLQPISDNSKANYALNISRAESDSVVLYNLAQNLALKQENFFAHYDDSGKVGLRVFGPIYDMTEDEICETKMKL